MSTAESIARYPSLQEQASFFDDWNVRYRAMGFEEIEPESKARATRVLEILSALPLQRPEMFEIGCGTGWLTEKLVEVGPTTALDLSEKAIEVARRRGLPAKFLAGDFYTEQFPPRHFDVAICLETISCVPDQVLFLEKAASLIKPGGYLILSLQNKFVYERRSDIGPPKPGLIRKWLSRREIRRLLNPRFRILKSTTVLPKGDRGILRIVNARTLNWLLKRLMSEKMIAGLKEKMGLGHTYVVLAERRAG